MDEQQQENVKRLAAPTPRNEIKKAPNGLDYVTARYVMNTLDSIVGPGNWSDSYRTLNVEQHPDGTQKWVVECTLVVYGVEKADVGIGESKLSGQGKLFGEPEKTAYSNALKRAGVKWGIARDLYGDGLPDEETDSRPQAQPAPVKKQQPPAVQDEGAANWTQGNLGTFWGYVKGTLHLSEDEVHMALGVDSVRDYTGTKKDAMETLKAYDAGRDSAALDEALGERSIA